MSDIKATPRIRHSAQSITLTLLNADQLPALLQSEHREVEKLFWYLCDSLYFIKGIES